MGMELVIHDSRGPGGGVVDVRALQRLVEESGLSLYEVAARMGFRDHRGMVDSSRLRRRLGLKAVYSRYERPGGPAIKAQERTTIQTAVAVVRALDLDPVDVGL